MAENPPVDDLTSEGSQPEKESTPAPGTEKVPGADVCAPLEVIRATTGGERLEIQSISGPPDFSVTTQYDGSNPGLLAMASSYTGPLPPPSYLKGYEEVVPGSAKEIISWVRGETEHRRQIETDESKHRRELETRAMDLGERALNSGIFRANTGMFLAWPMMILVILAGSYLVHTGHDKSGTAIVISGLGLVGGTYIVNKFKKPEGSPNKRIPDKDNDEDEKD